VALVRAGCLTLLVAAGLLATGCGDDDKTKTDAGANTSTAPAAPADPTAGPAAAADTATTAARTGSTGPDATVLGYFTALAGRDGDKACGLLTKGAQRQVLALAQKSTKKTFTSCGPALRATVTAADARRLKAVDVRIAKSEVDGDRATVRVERGVRAIELTRLGGRWYISGGFD